MNKSLSELLSGYAIETLRAIVSHQGVKVRPHSKKSEVVETLTEFFSDPRQIQGSQARLAPVQRQVVDLILQRGGAASVTAIRQHLLHAKLILPSALRSRESYYYQPNYRKPNSNQLDEVMANLLAVGLVFAQPETGSFGQPAMLTFNLAAGYTIPPEIRRHLPAPPPEPPWTPEPAEKPDRVDESSARTFQRDLYLYWSYVNQNQIQLTARGLIPKRHLVALNSTLLVRETIDAGQVESDFRRLVFLRELLFELGLVEEKNRTLTAASQVDFFALEPQARIQRTLEAYQAARRINEITWDHRIGAYSKPAIPAPDHLLGARSAVLACLKPATAWLPVTAVVGRLWESNYEFLFPRRWVNLSYSYSHPYSSSSNPFGWDFPGIFSEEKGWEEVESRFIYRVLSGPLFWMGLLELGYSSPVRKEPDCFRLTAAGSWLLAAGSAPQIRVEGGQVIVQPDFTITAFDPVSDLVLHQLDQFAQRISAERAAVFRLTQQSVYAGQREGWDAARIQACLEDLTGQPLASNIVRTLAEWQTWHERIRIRRDVSLLYAADPRELDILAQDERLSAWLQDRPAPNAAALPARQDTRPLFSLLGEKLWLPVVVPNTTKPARGSVTLDPDGRLDFCIPAPDLYLRAHLARFAEVDGDGYRLTPASVRKAVQKGVTAPQLINELKKVARDSLPEALEKKILAWAGHFGRAQVEELVLLRVRDEKVLKELLEDPELAPLLAPLLPADVRAAARVNPQDLDKLRRLLEERGVDFKG